MVSHIVFSLGGFWVVSPVVFTVVVRSSREGRCQPNVSTRTVTDRPVLGTRQRTLHR